MCPVNKNNTIDQIENVNITEEICNHQLKIKEAVELDHFYTLVEIIH